MHFFYVFKVFICFSIDHISGDEKNVMREEESECKNETSSERMGIEEHIQIKASNVFCWHDHRWTIFIVFVSCYMHGDRKKTFGMLQ